MKTAIRHLLEVTTMATEGAEPNFSRFYNDDLIIHAMNEYADNMAIEFAKWIILNKNTESIDVSEISDAAVNWLDQFKKEVYK